MTYDSYTFYSTQEIVLVQPLALLSKAHSSLEKQTSHLRQSGPLDSSEVYSSMERGMSEIHSGKCDPPGAQVVGSTVSICL